MLKLPSKSIYMDKKPTITFIVNDLPKISGTQIFSKRLAVQLDKLGLNVEILTNVVDHSLASFEISVRQYKNSGDFLSFLKDSASKSNVLLFFHLPYEIYVKGERREGFYKVMENIRIPKYLRFVTMQSIQELIQWYGKERLERDFDFMISQTPSMTEQLLTNFSREKVIELPNGVPLELFKKASSEEKRLSRVTMGIPDDANVFLYVGRYLDKKGIAILRDGWKYWRQRNPDESRKSYLLTVGYNPFIPNARYNVPLENLIDLGHLPEKEVVHALHASDFFVMPSKSEGVSNSLLEALSCGLPALVFKDSPGMEILDEETSLLIDNSDNPAESLASTFST